MKKYFTIFFFIVFGKLCFSQCVNADSLYTNNITYLNALANWKSAPVADHYIIHYRLLGTTNWSNLGNIDGSDTTRNIPQLLSDTTYEWQIKTFCDTSINLINLILVGRTQIHLQQQFLFLLHLIQVFYQLLQI